MIEAGTLSVGTRVKIRPLSWLAYAGREGTIVNHHLGWYSVDFGNGLPVAYQPREIEEVIVLNVGTRVEIIQQATTPHAGAEGVIVQVYSDHLKYDYSVKLDTPRYITDTLSYFASELQPIVQSAQKEAIVQRKHAYPVGSRVKVSETYYRWGGQIMDVVEQEPARTNEGPWYLVQDYKGRHLHFTEENLTLVGPDPLTVLKDYARSQHFTPITINEGAFYIDGEDYIIVMSDEGLRTIDLFTKKVARNRNVESVKRSFRRLARG